MIQILWEMMMRGMMDRIVLLFTKQFIVCIINGLAASFLSNLETSSSSSGKPEDDTMKLVLKQFWEFYNQDNEIRGEPASDGKTKVVSLAFKEIFSETALENLLTKVKKS